MMFPTTSVTLFALLGTCISGFGVVPALQRPRAQQSLLYTPLYAIRCEEKFYQLEEMEDDSTCTTELYLRKDNRIDIGQTDGPLFQQAKGQWNVKPGTNDFTMKLTKTFGTGSEGRDMGEFTFNVERTYIGEMTKVGASVAITGVAHTLGPDEEGNQEVGFFNMIDGTKERNSYGKEEDDDDDEPVEDAAVKNHDAKNTWAAPATTTNDSGSFASVGASSYSEPPSFSSPQNDYYSDPTPTFPQGSAASGYEQTYQQPQQQYGGGYNGDSYNAPQQQESYNDAYTQQQQQYGGSSYEEQYSQQQSYDQQQSFMNGGYQQQQGQYDNGGYQQQQQQQQYDQGGYQQQYDNGGYSREQEYSDQGYDPNPAFPPTTDSYSQGNYNDPNPPFPEQQVNGGDNGGSYNYDPNYSDYNY